MGVEDEQLRKFCPKCNRVTDWEDGYNPITLEGSEWCVECEEEE